MPGLDFRHVNLATNLSFHHCDARSLELGLLRKVFGAEQVRNRHVLEPGMAETGGKRRAGMTSAHLCPPFALFLRQVVEDVGGGNGDVCLVQPSIVLHLQVSPRRTLVDCIKGHRHQA